jgi:phytoene dehydrogenase-like protein
MADGIAIIGAGYAGLAAAAELASRGVACDIFEASRTLGGRARGVAIDGMTLDNGAHILVRLCGNPAPDAPGCGAGGSPETPAAASRIPRPVPFVRRLPAPLHWPGKASAQGPSWREKFVALRFMRGLKARHFRLPVDVTVAELLAKQPDRLRRFLWQPLAWPRSTRRRRKLPQVFVNVLRDCLLPAAPPATAATGDRLLLALPGTGGVGWLRGTAIHRARALAPSRWKWRMAASATRWARPLPAGDHRRRARHVAALLASCHG